MYYEAAKVRILNVVTTVQAIRAKVLQLPILPKKTIRIERAIVTGLMDRVEELQALLGQFEYSSDGFVKRYPEENKALRILECDE